MGTSSTAGRRPLMPLKINCINVHSAMLQILWRAVGRRVQGVTLLDFSLHGYCNYINAKLRFGYSDNMFLSVFITQW